MKSSSRLLEFFKKKISTRNCVNHRVLYWWKNTWRYFSAINGVHSFKIRRRGILIFLCLILILGILLVWFPTFYLISLIPDMNVRFLNERVKRMKEKKKKKIMIKLHCFAEFSILTSEDIFLQNRFRGYLLMVFHLFPLYIRFIFVMYQ